MSIKIWILLHSLVLITKPVTGVADLEVASHCAADQYCLRLYQLKESVQWDQAYNQCRLKGMELLSISDHNEQSQVETLLRNVTMLDGFQEYIWMSGRRSHNVTWTSIDLNNTFYGAIMINKGDDPNADEDNCLTGKFHDDGQSAIYNTVHCSEVMSAVKLICHRKTTSQDCTTDTTHDQYYHDGVCYTFVDADDRDWFSAQRLCQMRYRGDIFLNLPATYDNLGPITPWVSPGESMWIGAWRRPWKWISEYNEVSMRYFNWESGSGGKVTTDVTLCTVLRGDSGQWKDISCSTPCQYVICESRYSDQNLSISTTATSYPISTTTTSATATAASTEYSNWTTPSISNKMDKNEAAFKSVYIAVIAAGVIVVVILVLAVILIRRRRKMTTQTTEATYVNTDTPTTEITERDYASLATPHLTTIPNNVYDHLDNQTTTGDDRPAADYYNLPASDQSTGQEQSHSGYDGLNDVTSSGTADMLQGNAHYENVHDGIPASVDQSLQRSYGNINYGDHTGYYEMV